MNDSKEIILTQDSTSTKNNKLIEKYTEEKIKKSNFKRRYLTRAIWAFSFIIIILSFTFLIHLHALIISFSMISLSALFNILNIFISHKKLDFSLDAYISIIISYMIALVTFIIVPLDISTSLSLNIIEDNTSENYIDKKSIHNQIDLVWNIIYWTSIFINFLMMRFQIAFWAQGHPTLRQKLICTLKLFVKQIIVISILGVGALTFLLFKYLSLMKVIEMVKSIIQIINLLYCLSHVILLLGYGLVQLIFYFLSYTSTGIKLKISLKSLNLRQNELQNAVNKLNKDKIILIESCTQFIKKENGNISSLINNQTLNFCHHILSELNDYSFEFNELIKFKNLCCTNLKTPKLNEINDDLLANMLITIKEEYYQCCKKEASMLRIYSDIHKNCEIVDNSLNSIKLGTKVSDLKDSNPNENIKRKTSVVINASSSFNNNKKIFFLLPKIYPMWMNILTKSFAIFLSFVSILFLLFQINLPFLNYFNFIYLISSKILFSNFYLNYFFLVLYSSYFLVCCFYSLSKFKICEIYILVPHHTNKFGMAFNASMCNTLILGICYNILYFYSSIYDKNNDSNNSEKNSASAINEFFNSMKKVEIVYDNYIYFFPILLLLVVIITLLRKFRLFCFKFGKLNELEIDMDDIMTKSENEIISQETFKDEKEKINFDILEMIDRIYYTNNEDDNIL